MKLSSTASANGTRMSRPKYSAAMTTKAKITVVVIWPGTA
jgi:hypothetical protein